MNRAADGMRRYWDAAAVRNAAWYVDTSLDYDSPDMERFLATGDRVVSQAFTDAPVRPAATGVAVEIGSGLGRICRSLAETFDEVIGLDISAEMVSRATELITHPRVRFLVSDGVTLAPLADESADFVLSFTVFQHIPDPAVVRGYLAEAARVLRPGGVLAIQWNGTAGSRRWRLRRIVRSLRGRLGWGDDPYGRDAAEFLGARIPLAEVEAWLASDGLTVAGVQDAGSLFTWAWATKSAQCG